MVRAQQIFHVPLACLAELHPAMGTAILQHADFVRPTANHHHGTFTECRSLEIANQWDFGFQGAEQPVRAVPDPLQFGRIHVRVGINPVGHAARGIVRPGPAD